MGSQPRLSLAYYLGFGVGFAALAAASAVPAIAHTGDAAIATAVRECRQISNSVVRTGCYDAIPLGSPQAATTPAPTTAPPQRQAAVAAPTVSPPPAASFGQNQLPRDPVASHDEPRMVNARVMTAQERQSGVYLLTLEDGAQWQFIDAVARSYDAPRPGSVVEIHRASMGSYLMQYGGQKGIRIQRIR